MVKMRGNTRSSGAVKAASGNKVNHHKVKDNGKGKVKDNVKDKVKDNDIEQDTGKGEGGESNLSMGKGEHEDEYGRWVFDAVLAGGLVTRYKRKDKGNVK